MTTTFIRLLSAQDKGEALAQAVASCREGKPHDGMVFTVDPAAFSKVPNSPFAYWVDESIRDLFLKLPPFEGDGRTVKQGLATADDFRFVRAWWEVPAERRLDAANGPDWRKDLPAFQEWCRRRTRQGKYWVPFAKGGEYSPYYADIDLVVNWKEEGEEIRCFVDATTGKARSRVQNTEYYFRPGITWPLRAATFNPWPLPPATIFSVRSYAAFVPEDAIDAFLTLANSRIWDYLYRLFLGRHLHPEYLVGVMSILPWPSAATSQFGLTRRLIEEARARLSASECSPNNGGKESRGPAESNESIDQCGFRAYDVSARVASSVKAFYKERFGIPDGEDDPQETGRCAGVEPCDKPLAAIHEPVGIAFGRRDVRLSLNHRLAPQFPDPFAPLPVCPPAALLCPRGVPATTGNIVSEQWLAARPDASSLPPDGAVERPTVPDSEYPIEVPWNGILVDDHDHPHDITARLGKALEVLWGDKAYSVEAQSCQAFGVRDLRTYFRAPSGFFQDHLARYTVSPRKAPIYWPLSTGSGSYTVWLYYPRLTENTLYECVTNYVAPKIAQVHAETESLRPKLEGKASAEQRRRLEELGGLEAELEELRLELERVAKLGYKPDLDDGVVICASPLHALFRLAKWQKELREHWTRLAKGEFDWAHLALALWPERVRKACRTDKSIAIAHGLESLYEEPSTTEPRKKTARGRKKQ